MSGGRQHADCHGEWYQPGSNSESFFMRSSNGYAFLAARSAEPLLSPVMMNDMTSFALMCLPFSMSFRATWTDGMLFAFG